MTSTVNFHELRVRVIESSDKIKLPQRESLLPLEICSIILLDVETKHPLFLFGIPGSSCLSSVIGYLAMSYTFNELNSVSIGVTLTTIAMTLIGLFAMMVALILYIMGKKLNKYNLNIIGKILTIKQLEVVE